MLWRVGDVILCMEGDPVYNGGGVVQLLYTWVYSSHVDIAEIFELRSNSSD